ncbi:MAG: NAD(P)H-dependent glycerol-3-phosphate dehydrogenase [Pseudomonadales bacterium]|nr:NAD(P)H-dependent glycerol-3-phosphate dehydrogenase [Pseudomonadales bacterium]
MVKAKARNICVLGGGCFGTAIANMCAENGHNVQWWMRDEELASAVNANHENVKYLPGIALNKRINATSDINLAVKDADIVYLSIPSKVFRDIVLQVKDSLSANVILISTTKGIERESFCLMSQILKAEVPKCSIGVLSGPNLAKEILTGSPTATVIASSEEGVCQTIQETLSSIKFRVYSSSDLYGVELGGALKNIYAVAAGMAQAHKTGENTRSMLITRSLAEMGRLAACLGANPMTFLGLAGVGDLVATCSSHLSRNFQVGFMLGEGKTLDEASEVIGQTAEGINTIKMVKEKADELNVYMPIASALYQIIFEQQPLQTVIQDLMLGDHAHDVEFARN